jgi:hypothetical protein
MAGFSSLTTEFNSSTGRVVTTDTERQSLKLLQELSCTKFPMTTLIQPPSNVEEALHQASINGSIQ